MRRSRIKVRVGSAAAIVVTLLTAACASSAASGSSTSAAGTSAPSAAIFGHEDPASGQPFVVGMENQVGGTTIDNIQEQEAAKAAVTYVNEYLGGIGGRPLQVDYCDGGTSASAPVQCANTFIQAHVSAVLEGNASAAFAQAIINAKIPYLTSSPLSTPELTTSTNTYALSGGLPMQIVAAARAAQQLRLKSITALVIDAPGRPAAIQAFSSAFTKVGIKYTQFVIPEGTSDMTPQISAASGTGGFYVIGDAAFCLAALKSIQSLGSTKPVITAPYCDDPAVAGGLQGGLNGITISGVSSNFDPSTPEAKLYLAVLAKYAPKSITPTGVATGGYIAVVGFARLMHGFTGPATSAAIAQHIDAAGPVPMPIANGITFKCGKTIVPAFPAVCNFSSYYMVLDAAGNATETSVVTDPGALLAP